MAIWQDHQIPSSAPPRLRGDYFEIIPIMQKLRTALVVAVIFQLFFANIAAMAWGPDGHRYVNQVAAKKIPRDMPGFFRSAGERLAYLGPEPDRWRERVEPTLKNAQEPDHFLNMERLEGMGDLPPRRFEFIQKLYAKRLTIADEKQRDLYLPEDIGLQPYAAIEMYERLKVAFREYRKLKKENKPTKEVEQAAVLYAGVLGHYVADASQPLHATIHYNGWVGDNPNGYTTRKTIHGEFESDFVAKNVKPADFETLVSAPQVLQNPFADYVSYLRQSNALVQPLYELDKQHAFTDHGTPQGKEFVVKRLAAGSQMLVNLWYTAWVESAKEVPPYVPPKAVASQ